MSMVNYREILKEFPLKTRLKLKLEKFFKVGIFDFFDVISRKNKTFTINTSIIKENNTYKPYTLGLLRFTNLFLNNEYQTSSLDRYVLATYDNEIRNAVYEFFNDIEKSQFPLSHLRDSGLSDSVIKIIHNFYVLDLVYRFEEEKLFDFHLSKIYTYLTTYDYGSKAFSPSYSSYDEISMEILKNLNSKAHTEYLKRNYKTKLNNLFNDRISKLDYNDYNVFEYIPKDNELYELMFEYLVSILECNKNFILRNLPLLCKLITHNGYLTQNQEKSLYKLFDIIIENNDNPFQELNRFYQNLKLVSKSNLFMTEYIL